MLEMLLLCLVAYMCLYAPIPRDYDISIRKDEFGFNFRVARITRPNASNRSLVIHADSTVNVTNLVNHSSRRGFIVDHQARNGNTKLTLTRDHHPQASTHEIFIKYANNATKAKALVDFFSKYDRAVAAGYIQHPIPRYMKNQNVTDKDSEANVS